MRRLLIGCLIGLIATAAVAAKPGGPTTVQLTYPGLPNITYETNSDGRVTTVGLRGRPIISYDWSAAPYEVPMQFFDHWSVITSVSLDGSATQRVIDRRGEQRFFGSVLAHGREFRRPSALLDAYAADLGLPEGWQEGMNTTSPNDVRLQVNGKAINIHFRPIGNGVRVAEADGNPILWDIDLPLGVDGRLGQLVPSRLIVTSTGSVQLAPDHPIVDGIVSIWTNDTSGSHSSFGILRADTTVRSATVVPHTARMYVCGFTEFDYCWDYSGGSVCGSSVYLNYCDDGSGYYTPPPDDGSGGSGGPPPTKTPQEQQRDLYVAQGCSPVPSANQFIDSGGYGSTGLQNYFSFTDFKSSSANYVLVDSALVAGLGAMARTVTIPSLSDPGNGAGYRTPGANSATPCGDHCYGTAVDLSVRNSSGAHDCQIWNALAAAGNAAGGWVEPASMVAPNGGVPNHFHIAFDGRNNNNYGDACTN